jgi:hypothetical protein
MFFFVLVFVLGIKPKASHLPGSYKKILLPVLPRTGSSGPIVAADVTEDFLQKWKICPWSNPAKGLILQCPPPHTHPHPPCHTQDRWNKWHMKSSVGVYLVSRSNTRLRMINNLERGSDRVKEALGRPAYWLKDAPFWRGRCWAAQPWLLQWQVTSIPNEGQSWVLWCWNSIYLSERKWLYFHKLSCVTLSFQTLLYILTPFWKVAMLYLIHCKRKPVSQCPVHRCHMG